VYAFGAVNEGGDVRPGDKVLIVGRYSVLKEGKVNARGPVTLYGYGPDPKAVVEFQDLLTIRSCGQ